MKKRSLFAAIAMLVVSAIVLTSATFAWFSMGDSVSVTQFTVGVAEADGLMISADNSSWGTSVALSTIYTANNYKNIVYNSGDLMFPVSGTGDPNGTWFSGYSAAGTPVIEQVNRTGADPEKGLFFCFPVWILYKGTGTQAVDLSASTIANTSGATKDALKAARLAIAVGDTGTASKVYVPDNTDDSTYQYVSSVTGTVPTPTTFTNGVITSNLSDLSVTLTAGTAAKVWVVLWLEGTDAQCTDDVAAGGSLDVALTFTKA